MSLSMHIANVHNMIGWTTNLQISFVYCHISFPLQRRFVTRHSYITTRHRILCGNIIDRYWFNECYYRNSIWGWYAGNCDNRIYIILFLKITIGNQTVNLCAMQTASVSTGLTLSGTRIVGSKRFAAFSGSICGKVSVGDDYCDKQSVSRVWFRIYRWRTRVDR